MHFMPNLVVFFCVKIDHLKLIISIKFISISLIKTNVIYYDDNKKIFV